MEFALSYDGTKLDVSITDTVTNQTPTQSYTVDIPTLVGSGVAYVGFTAGTGDATAAIKVLNWKYTPTL